MLFDQIDRTAKAYTIENRNRVGRASRITLRRVRQSEREVRVKRLPFVFRRVAHPAAQVGTQIFYLITPDARDRGRELLLELGRHAVQRFVREIEETIRRLGL